VRRRRYSLARYRLDDSKRLLEGDVGRQQETHRATRPGRRLRRHRAIAANLKDRDEGYASEQGSRTAEGGISNGGAVTIVFVRGGSW